MSACIGWVAEPRCPVYGEMHGCELGDGHSTGCHAGHVCPCGATTRTRDIPIERAYARRHPIGNGRDNARAEGGTRGVVRAYSRGLSGSRKAR